MTTQSIDRPITGRHVLIALIAFFGIVFGVNGLMMWKAIGTFDGLETADSYRAARAFNSTIHQAERQAALGWTLKAQASPQSIVLALTDKAGAPIDGLSITAVLWRPTHDGEDKALTFKPIGRGLYEAHLAAPVQGRWEIRLETTAADGTPVKVRETVVVGAR
jgi:nitrogen fixation protein FixH